MYRKYDSSVPKMQMRQSLLIEGFNPIYSWVRRISCTKVVLAKGGKIETLGWPSSSSPIGSPRLSSSSPAYLLKQKGPFKRIVFR